MYSLTVTETLKNKIKVKVAPKEEWSADRTAKVIEFLELHPYLSFSDVMGAGSFGVVFKASKTDETTHRAIPRAYKVQFDNVNFSNVKELIITYKRVRSQDPDSYIILMEEPFKKNLYVDGVRVGFAGIEMELGMPGEKKYFTDQSKAGKTRNTKKLYEFFIKLMKGYNYFNQVKGFYHADVKPDNWLVIPQPDGGIEPRIIDFDLIFRHPKLICQDRGVDYYQELEPLVPKMTKERNEHGVIVSVPNLKAAAENAAITKRNIELRKQQISCNPSWVIYTLTFRPPELKSIVWNTNFEDDEVIRRDQKREWIERTWSSRFIEEAWSVGESMHDAININIDYLDQNCQEFELLARVINNLLKGNKNERPTLKNAIDYLEENRPAQRRLI